MTCIADAVKSESNHRLSNALPYLWNASEVNTAHKRLSRYLIVKTWLQAGSCATLNIKYAAYFMYFYEVRFMRYSTFFMFLGKMLFICQKFF